MADVRNALRIAVIGKTGAGKSALGNTLLRNRTFISKPSGESVTRTCAIGEGVFPSGRRVTVVDTPGILDTRQGDVRNEISKCIAYLSPGPHAIIIVLSPNRATEEERKVIRELCDFFGDDHFLKYTLIVMVRKNELRDEDGNPVGIHKFIKTLAADDVRQLYDQCQERIVAVENLAPPSEQEQYAQEIEKEIDQKMDGFYSHAYFQLVQSQKIRDAEIAQLRKKLEEITKEKKIVFCTIL